MIRKSCALLLSLVMVLGLAACGPQTADYMAESQQVSQWEQYETQSDVTLSVKGTDSLGFDAAKIRVQTKEAVDLRNMAASLSGRLDGEVDNLRLYGSETDIQTTYTLKPVYFRDNLLYLPVQTLCDALEVDPYAYGEWGYAENLEALGKEYVAFDPELSEENLAALELLRQEMYSAEQYEQLGQWLSAYTTGLRFGQNGRTYTLSGRLSQLPQEVISIGRFLYENIGALNDILDLGLTEEDVAAMEEMAADITLSQEEMDEISAALDEAGVEGEFTAQVAFADGKVTQELSLRVEAEGYGEWTLESTSVSRRRTALSFNIPDATEPMTATELENVIYGWSEESTSVSAWVDLSDGWTSTTYWDGAPASHFITVDIRTVDGETLLGFRALMEGMGFTVEYDAATDTIYFVDKAGVKTAIDLYEENGKSFISAQQLQSLQFDVTEHTEYDDYSAMEIVYLPSAS